MDGLYETINRWQTRLLRLHPGEVHERLEADLLVADIVHLPGIVLHRRQERVYYEAVSYTWGEPVYEHAITANGIQVAITASLHSALRHFRASDTIRYLWVDALCINQSNDEEKGIQVQNMFVIFSKASTVLAWLGEANERTAEAMRAVAQFGVPDQTDSSGEAGVSPSPVLTHERIRGLLDLCARPWVSRAWVQQEVFAAKRLQISCGDHTMSLQQYKAVGRFLEEQHSWLRLGSNISGALLARNLRVLRYLHQATQIDTIQLSEQRARVSFGLCKFRDRRDKPRKPKERDRCTRPECILADLGDVLASDPRDRIYALLALTDCQVSDVTPERFRDDLPAIPVDYSLSTSQVFQLLTKYLIYRDQSLEVLETHNPARSRDLSLPSWTPDWRDWSGHRSELAKPTINISRQEPGDDVRPALQTSQTYTDWDRLHVRGVIAGWFCASSSGPPELRIHRELTAIGLKRTARRDCLAVNADVAVGDLLVVPASVRHWDIVLRPRDAGGYTFVRSRPERAGDDTRVWQLVELDDFTGRFGEPGLKETEDFIVW